ncbi:MAG TPA: RidA family protein [Acidimicrobiia bacterium]|nr:RidA family protein [Acidimicrobiia bacterium]
MGHSNRIIPTPELGDPEVFGYSNCVKVGNLVFVAGQCSIDENYNSSGDFSTQSREVLRRVIHAVEAAGGSKGDIVTMTVFVLDVRKGREFTQIRREMFGHDFPASTLIGVSQLMPPEAVVEVQAIAVLP